RAPHLLEVAEAAVDLGRLGRCSGSAGPGVAGRQLKPPRQTDGSKETNVNRGQLCRVCSLTIAGFASKSTGIMDSRPIPGGDGRQGGPMLFSIPMRIVVAAFTLVLVSAAPGRATCDPTTDPDKPDIATARLAIATNCDCTVGTGHGDYVRCAVGQADATLQNPSCRGKVKRCAARSICGNPAGAVTCCIPTANGTRC